MRYIRSVIIFLLFASTILASQTITLNKQGWHLVGVSQAGSLPVSSIIEAKNINLIVTQVNGSWKKYDPNNTDLQDFSSFEGGRGYWIKTGLASTSLTFSGSGTAQTATMRAGWNLVAFPSAGGVTTALSSLVTNGFKAELFVSQVSGSWKKYDPNNTDLQDFSSLDTNLGYWVKVLKQLQSPVAIGTTALKISAYTDTASSGSDKTVAVTIKNGTSTVTQNISIPTSATKVYIRISDSSGVTKSEYLLTNASSVTAVDWKNNGATTEFDLKDFASTSSTAYTAYYAAAGSAPIVLSNVEIYDGSTYVGKTDANGRYAIGDGTYKGKTLTFVKDGYAAVSVTHSATGTASVFLSIANKSTASTISSTAPSKSTARPLTPTVKGRLYRFSDATSASYKVLSNTDNSFSAYFKGFTVADDTNRSIKLALLDPSNIKIDSNHTNISAFGVELVETDSNGFEKALPNAAFSALNSGTATPELVLDIALSKANADFVRKAKSGKNGYSLKFYKFNGSSWVEATELSNTRPTLENATDDVLTITGASSFTQYLVALKADATAVKPADYEVTFKDDAGAVISDINVSAVIMSKQLVSKAGKVTFNGVLPVGNIVDVKAFAEGYESFGKSVKLESTGTVVTLKKVKIEAGKTAVWDRFLIVKNGTTPIVRAGVKVNVPVTLSNVSYENGSIYVGNSAGATYSWYVRDVNGTNSYLISGASSNSVSQAKVFETLKAKNRSAGAFNIYANVKHKSGFEEKGDVGFFDIAVDASKVVNAPTFTGKDRRELTLDNWSTQNYVSYDGDFATGWELSADGKKEIIDSVELIPSDLGYFLSKHGLSASVKAYPVQSSGIRLGGAASTDYEVTFTVDTTKQISDVADIYVDVFAASAVPTTIETETSSDGTVKLTAVPKTLEFAISVKKDGYKAYADTKSFTGDENLSVALSPRAKISDIVLSVADSNGTVVIIDKNVTVDISEAVEKTIERNGETITKLQNLKVNSLQGSSGLALNTYATSGLVEGTKDIKVFVPTYLPYEGKLRVSTAGKKTVVIKLTKAPVEMASKESNLLKPFVDVTYKDVVSGKIVVKGEVSDMKDGNYSGLVSMSAYVNGTKESVSIASDGTFILSAVPQNGNNKISLEASNVKGKFSSGEFFINYKDISSDVSNASSIATQTQTSLQSDSSATFAEGSVFTGAIYGIKVLSDGSTVDTNTSTLGLKLNLKAAIDADTTLSVSSAKGKDKAIDTSIGLTKVSVDVGLVGGNNLIEFKAYKKGVLVDTFNISAYYKEKVTVTKSDIVLSLFESDGTTKYVGKVDVIVEEPMVNGQPGAFIESKTLDINSTGTKTIAVKTPSRLIIKAPNKLNEFKNVTASGSLSVTLYRNDVVNDFSGVTLSATSVSLEGADGVHYYDDSFYNVKMLDSKLDATSLKYLWKLNGTTQECTTSGCSISFGTLSSNKVEVTVTDKKGNAQTLSKTVKAKQDYTVVASANMTPVIYVPPFVDVVKDGVTYIDLGVEDKDGKISSATISIDANISLVNAFGKDITASAIEWRKDDDGKKWKAKVGIKGKTVGTATLSLSAKDDDNVSSIGTSKVYISSASTVGSGVATAAISVNLTPDFDIGDLRLSVGGKLTKQIDIFDPTGIKEANVSVAIAGVAIKVTKDVSTTSNDVLTLTHLGNGLLQIEAKAVGDANVTVSYKGLSKTAYIHVESAKTVAAPMIKSISALYGDQSKALTKTDNKLNVKQFENINFTATVEDKYYASVEWIVKKGSVEKYRMAGTSFYYYADTDGNTTITLKADNTYASSEQNIIVSATKVESSIKLPSLLVQDELNVSKKITIPKPAGIDIWLWSDNYAIAEAYTELGTSELVIKPRSDGSATLYVNAYDSKTMQYINKSIKLNVSMNGAVAQNEPPRFYGYNVENNASKYGVEYYGYKGSAVDIDLSWYFTDFDGNGTIAYSISSSELSPLNLTLKGSKLTGILPDTITEQKVLYVSATDNNSALTTAKLYITVPTNKAPQINLPDSFTAMKGDSVSRNLRWEIFEPDGETFTIAVSGLPDGLAFDSTTDTVTGKFTKVGSYTVLVTATDASKKSSSKYITIDIKQIESVPFTKTAYEISTGWKNKKSIVLPTVTDSATGKAITNWNIYTSSFDIVSAWWYDEAGTKYLSLEGFKSGNAIVTVEALNDNWMPIARTDLNITVAQAATTLNVPTEFRSTSGDLNVTEGREIRILVPDSTWWSAWTGEWSKAEAWFDSYNKEIVIKGREAGTTNVTIEAWDDKTSQQIQRVKKLTILADSNTAVLNFDQSTINITELGWDGEQKMKLPSTLRIGAKDVTINGWNIYPEDWNKVSAWWNDEWKDGTNSKVVKIQGLSNGETKLKLEAMDMSWNRIAKGSIIVKVNGAELNITVPTLFADATKKLEVGVGKELRIPVKSQWHAWTNDMSIAEAFLDFEKREIVIKGKKIGEVDITINNPAKPELSTTRKVTVSAMGPGGSSNHGPIINIPDVVTFVKGQNVWKNLRYEIWDENGDSFDVNLTGTVPGLKYEYDTVSGTATTVGENNVTIKACENNRGTENQCTTKKVTIKVSLPKQFTSTDINNTITVKTGFANKKEFKLPKTVMVAEASVSVSNWNIYNNQYNIVSTNWNDKCPNGTTASATSTNSLCEKWITVEGFSVGEANVTIEAMNQNWQSIGQKAIKIVVEQAATNLKVPDAFKTTSPTLSVKEGKELRVKTGSDVWWNAWTDSWQTADAWYDSATKEIVIKGRGEGKIKISISAWDNDLSQTVTFSKDVNVTVDSSVVILSLPQTSLSITKLGWGGEQKMKLPSTVKVNNVDTAINGWNVYPDDWSIVSTLWKDDCTNGNCQDKYLVVSGLKNGTTKVKLEAMDNTWTRMAKGEISVTVDGPAITVDTPELFNATNLSKELSITKGKEYRIPVTSQWYAWTDDWTKAEAFLDFETKEIVIKAKEVGSVNVTIQNPSDFTQLIKKVNIVATGGLGVSSNKAPTINIPNIVDLVQGQYVWKNLRYEIWDNEQDAFSVDLNGTVSGLTYANETVSGNATTLGDFNVTIKACETALGSDNKCSTKRVTIRVSEPKQFVSSDINNTITVSKGWSNRVKFKLPTTVKVGTTDVAVSNWNVFNNKYNIVSAYWYDECANGTTAPTTPATNTTSSCEKWVSFEGFSAGDANVTIEAMNQNWQSIGQKVVKVTVVQPATTLKIPSAFETNAAAITVEEGKQISLSTGSDIWWNAWTDSWNTAESWYDSASKSIVVKGRGEGSTKVTIGAWDDISGQQVTFSKNVTVTAGTSVLLLTFTPSSVFITDLSFNGVQTITLPKTVLINNVSTTINGWNIFVDDSTVASAWLNDEWTNNVNSKVLKIQGMKTGTTKIKVEAVDSTWTRIAKGSIDVSVSGTTIEVTKPTGIPEGDINIAVGSEVSYPANTVWYAMSNDFNVVEAFYSFENKKVIIKGKSVGTTTVGLNSQLKPELNFTKTIKVVADTVTPPAFPNVDTGSDTPPTIPGQ